MVKVDVLKNPNEVGFGLKFKGGRRCRGQAAISVAHVDPGSAASRYELLLYSQFHMSSNSLVNLLKYVHCRTVFNDVSIFVKTCKLMFFIC